MPTFPRRSVHFGLSEIGFELALYWVCFGFATLDIGPKLALFGFELGLFWVCFAT
jgi:hypothetical protein